ncbi:hypothetical protein [Streptacidiphilus albus]|uniref:hypothetical protein n=1 Tax=Streptacidiphilus albus TaxID=105425 RepID=UPI00128CCC98|nr:hypothetical protein [Streptacidiphilus albus]
MDLNQVRFFSIWQRLTVVMGGGVFSLVGLVDLSSGSWAARAFYAFIFVFGAAIAVLGARAGVFADDKGVLQRAVGLSKYIFWCDVSKVSVGPGDGMAPATIAPVLEKVDGSSVVLLSAASYGASTEARMRMQSQRDQLEVLRLRHLKNCNQCRLDRAEKA